MTRMGYVDSYDNITNMARIAFNNMNDPTGKILYLNNVPVAIKGGLHEASPKQGDNVWVEFIGGNRRQGRVISFADEYYATNTRQKRLRHPRHGAHTPDSICARVTR